MYDACLHGTGAATAIGGRATGAEGAGREVQCCGRMATGAARDAAGDDTLAANDWAGRRAADLELAGVAATAQGVGVGAAALNSTTAAAALTTAAAATSLAAAAADSSTAAAAAASTVESAAAVGLILYRLDEPKKCRGFMIRLSWLFPWVAPRACATSARLTAR